MKHTKKLISALLLLAMMTALLAGCAPKKEVEQESETPSGAATKFVSVAVTHKDGEKKIFVLETTEETLGRALVTEGLVEDNQTSYGLYILTADGETADEANEEWWCITRGGEQIATGADEIVIADGDSFELTFTVGYDYAG